MVGRMCHSSFKAAALEVIFDYEPFWLANTWHQPSPGFTLASSDPEFGRRVLTLAGSSALPHFNGVGIYTPGILLPASRGAALQS